MKIRLPNLSRLIDLRDATRAAGESMAAERGRFAQIANRHDNGTAPRAVTAYQLFQTPPEIAAQLAGLLNLQPGARILEPSAGLGRLLDAVSHYEPAEIVAVEKSAEVAKELRAQGRPGVRVVEGDFLALDPADYGAFDAVIMNPPFHMRDDVKHIEHARTFLKYGGKLAAICMDTDKRAERLRPEAIDWIPLLPGAFKSAGTDVGTVLCTFTL